VLDYLKSKRAFIGIITGKGTQSTALTLSRYGLHGFFDVVKTGSSAGPVKDVRIDEVVDEFSLEREETLYVGDAPGDIAASRTSGIAAAAAAWAPTADREALQSMDPDYLFTSVREFSEFIKGAYSDSP